MTANTKTPIVKNCGDILQNDCYDAVNALWMHVVDVDTQDIDHFTPPHLT